MKDKLKLISANLDHIELITNCRMKLWDQACKFKNKDEFDYIYKLNKKYFYNNFHNDNLIVPIYLDEKNDIIAIGIGVVIQKPIVNLDNIGLEGYIFNMYTDERYRKIGLATNILFEIEKFFKRKKCKKITLVSNENSINLYKNNGMYGNDFYLEKIIK